MKLCTQEIKVSVLSLFIPVETDLYFDLYLRFPTTVRNRPARCLLEGEKYCTFYGAILHPEHHYSSDYDKVDGVFLLPRYNLDEVKTAMKNVPNNKQTLISVIADPGLYWQCGLFLDAPELDEKEGCPGIRFHSPIRRFTEHGWEVTEK